MLNIQTPTNVSSTIYSTHAVNKATCTRVFSHGLQIRHSKYTTVFKST